MNLKLGQIPVLFTLRNVMRGLFVCAVALTVVAAGAAFGGKAAAQSGPSSLIDTMRNTKIWADPVEPKDFVRESRPPVSSLQYQATTGAEAERPKRRP